LVRDIHKVAPRIAIAPAENEPGHAVASSRPRSRSKPRRLSVHFLLQHGDLCGLTIRQLYGFLGQKVVRVGERGVLMFVCSKLEHTILLAQRVHLTVAIPAPK
jgi:hypothetical protein